MCVGGSEPHAQSQWLTGYLQTVPLWTASTQFAKSNVANFNRFRLTSEPVFDDAKSLLQHRLRARDDLLFSAGHRPE